MNIYDEIKKLPWKKQLYFKWRFDLEYDRNKPKHTEERLCRLLKTKTLNEYLKWEKSPQFLALTNLVLETKFANDLEKAYLSVSEKAQDGDEKAIKLMLDLQKQIRSFNQSNLKARQKPKEDEIDYSDLELD